MVEDCETPEEREFYMNITTAQFGTDPKKIRWTDPEDPPTGETHLSRHDAKVTETARELYGNILKEKQDDASNRSTS